ncbi:MAG: HNH endonuclease, partial [Clostridium sp.]
MKNEINQPGCGAQVNKKVLIKGYEDRYLIEDSGVIYSLKTNKPLKPYKENNGYLRVGLWDGSCYKRFSVHRLVYENFIGKIDEGKQINHKDGNKENNSIENLEEVSCSENNLHAHRTGLHINNGSKPVDKYGLSGEFIESFSSLTEACKAMNSSTGNMSERIKLELPHK